MPRILDWTKTILTIIDESSCANNFSEVNKIVEASEKTSLF